MTARVTIYAVIAVHTPPSDSHYATVNATFSSTADGWRTWSATFQRERVDRPSRWEVGPRASYVVAHADHILEDPCMVANGGPAGIDAVPGFGHAYGGSLSGSLDACHGEAWEAWARALKYGCGHFGRMLEALKASRRIDLALRWRYPVDGDGSTGDREWGEVPAEARGWARRWALNAPEVMRARAAQLVEQAAIAESLEARRREAGEAC